jgi:hypothetical protein
LQRDSRNAFSAKKQLRGPDCFQIQWPGKTHDLVERVVLATRGLIEEPKVRGMFKSGTTAPPTLTMVSQSGMSQSEMEQRYSLMPMGLTHWTKLVAEFSMDTEAIGYFQSKTLLQRERMVDKKPPSRVSSTRTSRGAGGYPCICTNTNIILVFEVDFSTKLDRSYKVYPPKVKMRRSF